MNLEDLLYGVLDMIVIRLSCSHGPSRSEFKIYPRGAGVVPGRLGKVGRSQCEAPRRSLNQIF